MLGSEPWKKLSTGFCMFLLLGFAACSDDNEVLEIFDQERLYRDINASGFFDAIDEEDELGLDAGEFNSGFFLLWDVDGFGTIDADEFQQAATDFDLEGAVFADWDTDDDGAVELDEFNAAFAAYNHFNTFDADADGIVMEREFAEGIFMLWADGSETLVPTEYNRLFSRYFVL